MQSGRFLVGPRPTGSDRRVSQSAFVTRTDPRSWRAQHRRRRLPPHPVRRRLPDFQRYREPKF